MTSTGWVPQRLAELCQRVRSTWDERAMWALATELAAYREGLIVGAQARLAAPEEEADKFRDETGNPIEVSALEDSDLDAAAAQDDTEFAPEGDADSREGEEGEEDEEDEEYGIESAGSRFTEIQDMGRGPAAENVAEDERSRNAMEVMEAIAAAFEAREVMINDREKSVRALEAATTDHERASAAKEAALVAREKVLADFEQGLKAKEALLATEKAAVAKQRLSALSSVSSIAQGHVSPAISDRKTAGDVPASKLRAGHPGNGQAVGSAPARADGELSLAKIAILDLAARGEPRPEMAVSNSLKKNDYARMLWHLINERDPSYDRAFADELERLRPEWFRRVLAPAEAATKQGNKLQALRQEKARLAAAAETSQEIPGGTALAAEKPQLSQEPEVAAAEPPPKNNGSETAEAQWELTRQSAEETARDPADALMDTESNSDSSDSPSVQGEAASGGDEETKAESTDKSDAKRADDSDSGEGPGLEPTAETKGVNAQEPTEATVEVESESSGLAEAVEPVEPVMKATQPQETVVVVETTYEDIDKAEEAVAIDEETA